MNLNENKENILAYKHEFKVEKNVCPEHSPHFAEKEIYSLSDFEIMGYKLTLTIHVNNKTSKPKVSLLMVPDIY